MPALAPEKRRLLRAFVRDKSRSRKILERLPAVFADLARSRDGDTL